MKFNSKIQFFGLLLLNGLLVALPVNRAVAKDIWEKLNEHEFQQNEGIEEYIWKEQGAEIPDYPEDKNLLEVAGPPAYRNYQYLIDGKNLQVGEDDVVRYSIVIRSPDGVDNVMFEGLHCDSAQIKNYAYGSTDMTGKKVFFARQNVQWQPVRSSGVTGYTESLRVNYFCNMQGAILTRHEIIQNIKYGKGNVDGLYY